MVRKSTSQLASVSPCYLTSDVKRPFLREARSPNRTEHTRYGENTSCIEVRSARGTLVVLDCGTGAHSLGQHPMSTSAKGLRGHILNQSSLCAVLRPAFCARQSLEEIRPTDTRWSVLLDVSNGSMAAGPRKDAATNCIRWFLSGLIHCCGMKAGSVTHNPTEQE